VVAAEYSKQVGSSDFARQVQPQRLFPMKKNFICSHFQLRILCALDPVASVGLRLFFPFLLASLCACNQVFVLHPEVRLQSSFSTRLVFDFLACPTTEVPKTFHQHSVFVARFRFHRAQKFYLIPFIFPSSIFSWPYWLLRRFCRRATHLALGSAITVALLCSEFFESTRRT
jgi:hypothetical protein